MFLLNQVLKKKGEEWKERNGKVHLRLQDH